MVNMVCMVSYIKHKSSIVSLKLPQRGRQRREKKRAGERNGGAFCSPARKHDTALYDGQFVNVSIECTGLAPS